MSEVQEDTATKTESLESLCTGHYDCQDMHSLLLCPSQWSRLLESPISLVRQTEERGTVSINSSCIYQPSENICVKDFLDSERSSSLKSTEPDSSLEHRTLNTQCTRIKFQVAENANCVNGKVFNEESTTILEEITEEDLPNETETEDQVYGNQLSFDTKSSKLLNNDKKIEDGSLNLTHVLAIPPPTLTSSEELCSSNNSTIDKPIQGRDTPVCEEKGLCSPPLSKLTHTRNISETPSLPPFINSSTSSAYHSRNSSLASQITSDWFDSDSHSADIDSCIVMHSGEMNLQDSKFMFPDFHSMNSKSHHCYSFTDLRSPVQVPDSIFLPTPELEDTICTSQGVVNEEDNVSNETFDQKHLASAMKSSEWIKREIRRARSSLVQVKVSSKSSHVVHFNVKAGDMFIWEFATKRKDIGFGLQFESTAIETSEQSEGDSNTPPPKKKMIAILPTLRVNSYAHPTVGSHTANQDGVYEILFDNSYSRFFAKELFYRITTKPAIPNKNYLEQ